MSPSRHVYITSDQTLRHLQAIKTWTPARYSPLRLTHRRTSSRPITRIPTTRYSRTCPLPGHQLLNEDPDQQEATKEISLSSVLALTISNLAEPKTEYELS